MSAAKREQIALDIIKRIKHAKIRRCKVDPLCGNNCIEAMCESLRTNSNFRISPNDIYQRVSVPSNIGFYFSPIEALRIARLLSRGIVIVSEADDYDDAETVLHDLRHSPAENIYLFYDRDLFYHAIDLNESGPPIEIGNFEIETHLRSESFFREYTATKVERYLKSSPSAAATGIESRLRIESSHDYADRKSVV